MAIFGGLVKTNAGRNLDAKVALGKELKFKRVALGDGELGPSESMLTLTRLKNEKLNQDIVGISIIQNDKVKVTFKFTNQGLKEGFIWREIGLIAEDPDTQEEILYLYGNARENGEYISPEGGADILEKNIDMIIITSNTQNISAIIDKSLIYVTQKEFEELKNEMKNQIIVSEEDPQQEECIWYQIINSKPVPSEIAEIMVEVADKYDENSTYQLETITNMTDNQNDENKIIEKEE